MKQRSKVLILALALAPVSTFAQSAYPSKPALIFVGYTPGDTPDLVARVVAPASQTYFRQPVLLENRMGNNGNVAAMLVAKSQADGHTLLFATPALAANAGIYTGLAFHPLRDFVAVARVANVHELLVVPAATRFRTLADLPNVPTFDESGVPGFEAVVWNAVVAPAGTPAETIVRLSLGITDAVASSATREKLVAIGAEPATDTPELFTKYLRDEVEKWAKVAQRSSIALE